MNYDNVGQTPYGYYGNQSSYGSRPNQQIRQYDFVNGIEGAKSYQLAPKQNMMLMDSDYSICYKKCSDEMGRSSLRYFKLEEIDEATARSIMQPQQVQTINYATKDDIDAINKKLDELFKRLDRNKKETKDNG